MNQQLKLAQDKEIQGKTKADKVVIINRSGVKSTQHFNHNLLCVQCSKAG